MYGERDGKEKKELASRLCWAVLLIVHVKKYKVSLGMCKGWVKGGGGDDETAHASHEGHEGTMREDGRGPGALITLLYCSVANSSHHTAQRGEQTLRRL